MINFKPSVILSLNDVQFALKWGGNICIWNTKAGLYHWPIVEIQFINKLDHDCRVIIYLHVHKTNSQKKKKNPVKLEKYVGYENYGIFNWIKYKDPIKSTSIQILN